MPEFQHIAGAPTPVGLLCHATKTGGWLMLAVDAPVGTVLVARRWS